ncbi:MAG: hypothetical protein ABIN96_02120, partial [Rubrivivax sp.]
ASMSAPAPSVQQHPDVLKATVRPSSGAAGRWDFDVTISSPYDSPERYADAFRVRGPDGTVYGVRTLWHDHADEQPFTRDLHGVAVPAAVRSISVQGRDQRHGWGGKTLQLSLPAR